MAQTQALAGMTAFITGGSGSIGSASARKLAADGAAVVIMSRREEALAQVKADIQRKRGQSHYSLAACCRVAARMGLANHGQAIGGGHLFPLEIDPRQ
jgi:NAD(P)-dependent dehydrogenase (short-subunit alcohol dehydrogenase family)